MGGLPGTVVAVPSGQLILVVPFALTIRVVLPSALISFEEPSGLGEEDLGLGERRVLLCDVLE